MQFPSLVKLYVRLGHSIRLAKVQIFGKFLYRRVSVKAKHHDEIRDEDLPKEIEILSPFYGVKYASMFVNTCLPSVLQSGVDKLCRKIPTRLSIHCPQSDWQEIKNHVLEKVGDLPIDVKWFPLESINVDLPGKLISFVRSRVQESINMDRVLVFGFPDHIFGRGLDRVIANSEHGEYIVCLQIRTSYELGANFFKSIIDKNDYRNCDLVKFGLINFPHALVRMAFAKRHDYLHFRKHDDTFLGYFKEPPPILMRGSEAIFEAAFKKVLMSDFACIDHDIPNLMLKHGMLRAVDDSEYFCWLEQTSDSAYQEMISNGFHLESALYLKHFGVKLRIKA